MRRSNHPEIARALNSSRRPELRMVKSIESLHAKLQLLPLEGHGEHPLDRQRNRIILHACDRGPGRAAVVAVSLGERRRIEKLRIGAMRKVKRLPWNEIWTLILVAIILTVC